MPVTLTRRLFRFSNGGKFIPILTETNLTTIGKLEKSRELKKSVYTWVTFLASMLAPRLIKLLGKFCNALNMAGAEIVNVVIKHNRSEPLRYLLMQKNQLLARQRNLATAILVFKST